MLGFETHFLHDACSFSAFKGRGNLLQQLPDGQMLRADLFAFAAADAGGGFAVSAPGGDTVIHAAVPVVERFMGVHGGEDIRNQNVLGTMILLDAVPAGSAGNQIQTVENIADLPDRLLFAFIQRHEIPHGGKIILHLCHIAHAGEHHGHVRKAGGKTQGIAGVAAAVQTAENLIRLRRQIDQASALDRLHDDDGLAMFLADLVHLPAFHGGVLIIHVVELDLHDLDLRMLGQDHVQHLGLVMEGDAKMADLSLGLQLQCCFISPTALELWIVVPILGVHQVKVKIIYAAGLQLTFKEGEDILFASEIGLRQLVRQEEFAPGMTLGHAVPDGCLGLSVDITVRGVKVVETGANEGIRHAAEFVIIHMLFLHGQAHAAKAEVAVDLREKGILDHVSLLLNSMDDVRDAALPDGKPMRMIP